MLSFDADRIMTNTIEDIVLTHDRRGMGILRPHLPDDYCRQAARYILENPGPVIIVTGFYILMSDAPETDGPPGAIAIGDALRTMGASVTYVVDSPMAGMMQSWLTQRGDPSGLVEFAISDDPDTNRQLASNILAEVEPALLIAIERCSPDDGGVYRNMRGRDISPQTARIDGLFQSNIPSVGIGDGGNEIGMANLAPVIRDADQLPDYPANVGCDRLIVASTSNWGGYGLVAALSNLVGRNLLPDVDADSALIRYLVDAGAVSGVSGEHDYLVDEFTLEENAAILNALHDHVDRQLAQGS